MTELFSLDFRRASDCQWEACVEVATHPDGGGVTVRDSKDPHGPRLLYSAEQWRALIASMTLGDWPKGYFAWDDDREHCAMTVPGDKTALRFSGEEMAVFEKGVFNGEFALPPIPATRPPVEDDPAYQTAGRK